MPGSSQRAVASLRSASLPKKAVTLVLSLLFALALVPTAAWGQLGSQESNADAAGSAAALADDSGDAESAPEGAAQEAASDDDGSPADDLGSSDTAAQTADDAIVEAVGNSSARADAGESATAGDEADDPGSNGLASDSAAAVSDPDQPSDSSGARAADEVSAAVSVIGRNADGDLETWAASSEFDLPEGSTAADLTVALFEQAGLDADYDPSGQYGFSLNTITSPADSRLTLGWDAATGRYWQLFVNGAPSDRGASFVVLKPGDVVTWCYSAYGESLPSAEPPLAPASVSAAAAVIGRDADGTFEDWAAEAAFRLPEGSTAADLTEALLEASGLQADYGYGEYGFFLNTITSPNDPDFALGWDEATGRYWQLFVNGAPATTGASSVVLQPGDVVTWCYSAYGESLPAEKITVFGSVIGRDAQGEDEAWVPLGWTSVPEGSTAADYTKAMFEANGIQADYTDGEYGFFLNTITSPSDPGRTLGWDEATGRYWQLFVNGTASEAGASSVVLEPGDTVTWYYSAFGEGLPGSGDDEPGDDTEIVDGIEVDADAPRPDWDAQWPSFGTGSAPEGAVTPTESADGKWVQQLKDQADYSTYLSDPLIVNGRVYIAVGSQLEVLNASTGEKFASADLVAPIDSIARMVYADGVIVVPVQGGRLQALTADALTTVWITDELAAINDRGKQQSLGTLTVSSGRVYYGTAAVGWSGPSYNGYFTCVDLATGNVVWSNANASAGYYWSGAAAVGDRMVVGDDAGSLYVLDAATGDVSSMLTLSGSVRSTAVAGTQQDTVLVATTDGVLHKIYVDPATGSARELASVTFGSSTTSTPAVVGGKVYIGGSSLEGEMNEWGYTVYGGELAVIDEATMTVDYAVTTYDGGTKLPADSKSAPLVSVQPTGTYVYFTCNAKPGGVYCYRVGDGEATLVYLPDEEHQNYSMSSVVCGADGVLYFINDSGALFAISAGTGGGSGASGGSGTGGGGTGQAGTVSGGGFVGGRSNAPFTPFSPGVLAASAPAAPVADAESADDAEDLPTSAAVKATKALMEDGSASDGGQAGGFPAWLPVAGLVVGAGGLVVAGVLVSRLMRRG